MPTDRDDETVQTQAPPSSQPNAPRARDSRPSLPAMLGRYRVIKLLGRGGVGAVYEAEDPEVGRRVAIKVLRDDKEGDTEALRGEAQALGRLVHPNVVSIYDVGVADGDVFLVMQLVDGEPLDRWLASRLVSPREILAMFRQADPRRNESVECRGAGRRSDRARVRARGTCTSDQHGRTLGLGPRQRALAPVAAKPRVHRCVQSPWTPSRSSCVSAVRSSRSRTFATALHIGSEPRLASTSPSRSPRPSRSSSAAWCGSPRGSTRPSSRRGGGRRWPRASCGSPSACASS